MDKSIQVFTWESSSMNKFIQVFTRKSNYIFQRINLYKCLRERLSCFSMDKSIQVFAWESNSMSQWINLYKCLRERVILCIDLYVSLCVRE